jgi:hypothetical protein
MAFSSSLPDPHVCCCFCTDFSSLLAAVFCRARSLRCKVNNYRVMCTHSTRGEDFLSKWGSRSHHICVLCRKYARYETPLALPPRHHLNTATPPFRAHAKLNQWLHAQVDDAIRVRAKHLRFAGFRMPCLLHFEPKLLQATRTRTRIVNGRVHSTPATAK